MITKGKNSVHGLVKHPDPQKPCWRALSWMMLWSRFPPHSKYLKQKYFILKIYDVKYIVIYQFFQDFFGKHKL